MSLDEIGKLSLPEQEIMSLRVQLKESEEKREASEVKAEAMEIERNTLGTERDRAENELLSRPHPGAAILAENERMREALAKAHQVMRFHNIDPDKCSIN